MKLAWITPGIVLVGQLASAVSVAAPQEAQWLRGLKLLRSPEPREACRGAAVLSKVEQRDVVLALLARREEAGESVLACTTAALRRLDVAPVLLDWWRSANPERRQWTLLHALVLSQPDLMVIYQEAYTSPDPLVRDQVTAGLQHQRATAQVIALLSVLAADPDVRVRGNAMLTLLSHRNPEGLRVLHDRLRREPDAVLRSRLIQELTRSGNSRGNSRGR